ncbi:hypothetical protein [Pseudomonas putida]|uniref:hypothetical protein n=1 Tax=Pseudomonas putida TaxID=303 RepID=UPI002889A58F|nr:hypothetical protein [Pseudomonas putida]WNI07714.1 hypothetical protein RIF00_24885 [Pseudomonas putida]
MQIKSVALASSLLFSLSQLLSGCTVNVAEQNAMLDSCMGRFISGAEYVTSRTSPEQVVNISYMECQREFFSQGLSSRQQPQMSETQKLAYEGLARHIIDKSPAYRFEVKRDEYESKTSVSGIDYVENAGASENYYTKASLSARKTGGGQVRYYIEVLRSGSERAELSVAYFKGGPRLAATPVGGNVNCVSAVFCFWTEGAVVEVSRELLVDGKPLDFKLSGRADSDPVQIPGEYVSMFMAEVNKSM